MANNMFRISFHIHDIAILMMSTPVSNFFYVVKKVKELENYL